MLSKIKRFHPMHRSLQSWELILDLWVLSLLLFTKSALPCSEKLSIFYTHCLCSVITWAFLTNYHNTVLISSILMKFVSSHVVIDSHVDSPQFPSTDFLKYWIFSQIYVQKHFSPLYLLSTPLDLPLPLEPSSLIPLLSLLFWLSFNIIVIWFNLQTTSFLDI